MARRYKDEKISMPDEHEARRASRAIAAAQARHKAYTDRYAAATREALSQAKANPDYQIIVEYLAACSLDHLEHIVLDVLITNVLERGCTLTRARIKSLLERDLKLKTWYYGGEELVMVPHGWTQERGPYPLDVSQIWESWVWYPPDGSEWA